MAESDQRELAVAVVELATSMELFRAMLANLTKGRSDIQRALTDIAVAIERANTLAMQVMGE